jgi:hypothetical protein
MCSSLASAPDADGAPDTDTAPDTDVTAPNTGVMWRIFFMPFGLLIGATMFLSLQAPDPDHVDGGVIETLATVIVALLIAVSVSPAFRVTRTSSLVGRRRIASGSAGMTAVGCIGVAACFLVVGLNNYDRVLVWTGVSSALVDLVFLSMTPLLIMEDGL